MLKQACLATAAVLGVAALANGSFMLLSPHAWYLTVPGVTSSGPFNQHFIRDIGVVFLLLGAAFLVGIARPETRLFAWCAATLWLGCHALFHLWEVAVGMHGPSALARDFPAVTLPALLGIGLTVWATGDRRPVRAQFTERS
jgi:hypothetical protein